jgi:hypothetical protein
MFRLGTSSEAPRCSWRWDLNGDGKPDVVAAGYGNVSVLLNLRVLGEWLIWSAGVSFATSLVGPLWSGRRDV